VGFVRDWYCKNLILFVMLFMEDSRADYFKRSLRQRILLAIK
jgi:hypothetical protein